MDESDLECILPRWTRAAGGKAAKAASQAPPIYFPTEEYLKQRDIRSPLWDSAFLGSYESRKKLLDQNQFMPTEWPIIGNGWLDQYKTQFGASGSSSSRQRPFYKRD